MTIVIVVLAIGVLAGLGFAVRWFMRGHARVCPTCHERALVAEPASTGYVPAPGGSSHPVEAFHCDACGADFWQPLRRGPLIPQESWQALAGGTFPTARVHRR